MANIDVLAEKYERHISLPWQMNLSGAEKVIMAVYTPTDERRLRARREVFELATTKSDHGWRLCDLTYAFEHWLAQLGDDYSRAYFEEPSDLEMAYEDLLETAADQVRQALKAPGVNQNTVVAVLGASTLFSFIHVSALISEVQRDIQGRMLVFFPGTYDDNQYRLLDVRDGWNYQAIPITS